MSLEISSRLRRLTNLVDVFSASLLIAKRELLTIHDAPFGAISLDFIGLGAENMHATTQAVVQAKSIEDAIARARAGERRVTASFEQRKARVAKVFKNHFGGDVSIRFSGDDGIAILRHEIGLRDQLQLMKALAALMPRPYFRMVVIHEGLTSSSQRISHGESIEKALRRHLLKLLGPKFVNGLHLNVFIPSGGPKRKVFLTLFLERRLNMEERSIVRSSFEDSVTLVKSDIQAQGLDIEYEPVDAFALIKH